MIEHEDLSGVGEGDAPRLISGQSKTPAEEAIERALRPQRLNEYIGQDKVRDQLGLFIQAALQRSEALDHVLLFGPRGLAKPHWPIFSRGSLVSIYVRPLARCWSGLAIWRRC